MKQRPRIYYTETQKDLMWERWQKGELRRVGVDTCDTCRIGGSGG